MSISESVDLDEVRIDPVWALRIPVSLALRRRVLPLALLHGSVHVACEDTPDEATLEAITRFTGHPVTLVRAETEALSRALARTCGDGRNRPAQIREGQEEDAVALAEELLRAALLRKASDIHIDPARDHVRVRLRVDGGLEEYRRLPVPVHAGLCSRLKVMAGMDIAERRAPQDGGFSWQTNLGSGQLAVDVRAASLPTRFGERITLRLLPVQEDWLTLEMLGMSDEHLTTFSSTIAQPHGMVLLTGPTGSGKTTTLSATARRLLAGAPLNIISVEDPVEYEIPGIAQVEVDSADKVSFSKALRSLLRHDPDVLIIGEIRDAESLDIAVKASLTGHLVFSTLHTNSAVSVITRLLDMGLPAHLAAATLRLSLAQRLVRRLCARCRKPVPLSAAHATALGMPDAAGSTVYEPQGCLYCAGRGFTGRMGLFELAEMTPELAGLITSGAPEHQLAGSLAQSGFRTLLADGAEKILTGQTSVAEVLAAAALT